MWPSLRQLRQEASGAVAEEAQRFLVAGVRAEAEAGLAAAGILETTSGSGGTRSVESSWEIILQIPSIGLFLSYVSFSMNCPRAT